jgi:DNA mismatch endonuclease (patch repair protein)
MSSVKNKNTKQEILVRKALFKKGFRYRINDKNLPGSPDIVLPKYKTVVFIHGCYWHGHENCSKAIKPSTNKEFWNNKIEQNKQRDKNAQETLAKNGWNVMTVWECQLKNQVLFKDTINNLIDNIDQIKC